jgi:hypothetical protein
MSTKGQSVISTPSGGGSVSGLGETFSPDLFTGTGNFSVPIATPQGLNGFQPELTLGYSTGNGNSPFGLGWDIGIPGVMRKTAKGIPLYDNTDVFILSGAEDLVNIGNFSFELNGITLNATQYRPRTEGLFARILHVSDTDNNFWLVTSKDGLQSFYGTPLSRGNDPAVVHQPGDPHKVFAWKLSKTLDTFGNRIDYSYFFEHSSPSDLGKWTQSYLHKISYAHYFSGGTEKALAQVHFEYEQRPDPFSSFKQGFEVRTTLRCKHIKTFSQPLNSPLVAVQQYNFMFVDQVEQAEKPLNNSSMLHSIRVKGIDSNDEEYMPPIVFSYTNYQPGKQKIYPIGGQCQQPAPARPHFAQPHNGFVVWQRPSRHFRS